MLICVLIHVRNASVTFLMGTINLLLLLLLLLTSHRREKKTNRSFCSRLKVNDRLIFIVEFSVRRKQCLVRQV